ncbi:MAG TPA: hypothetical protein EYQ72_05170 [Gammaproteobacteria bacterium]|nr:hypothetical protein [Gammaproteobacteria bacterium]
MDLVKPFFHIYGIGAGIELSQPLAIAVVGGMISSTFLSLIVVPIIYSWSEKNKFSSV